MSLFSEQSSRRIADEQLGIAAVHAQHLDRLVPGLIADFQKAHAALHCTRHKSGPQAVSTEGRYIEAKPSSTRFHDAGNGSTMQAIGADTLSLLVPDAPEDCAVGNAGRVDPCLQCRNRAGRSATRNGNGLAQAFLVGLASA